MKSKVVSQDEINILKSKPSSNRQSAVSWIAATADKFDKWWESFDF